MSFLYSGGLFDVIPDSGVARWEFEQDVTDSWGGNDGTDNTSAGYTTSAPVGSYAKVFDGVDDYVGVGANWTFGGGQDFTVSAWINTDTLQNQAILKFGDGWGDGLWQLGINDNGGTEELRYNANDISSNIVNSNLTDGTDHHVVAAHTDNMESRLYIDGTRQNTVPIGSMVDASATLRIGAWGPSNGRYCDGVIDDPRIYSKSLSDTEVSNLYQTGSISG